MPRNAPPVRECPRDRPSVGRAMVLGGGIAGLAAADRLNRAGWTVDVIEREPAGGGNHRARNIGPYTFDVGSMFYEHDARLFDLAPDLRDACPQVIRRQRRITPDGEVRHYPIDPGEFLNGSPRQLASAIIDLAWSRMTVRRDGTLDAICRQRLGRRPRLARVTFQRDLPEERLPSRAGSTVRACSVSLRAMPPTCCWARCTRPQRSASTASATAWRPAPPTSSASR